MAALREILIAFGMSVDTAPIDKANKKADTLVQKLEKFGKALGVLLVAKRAIGEAFDLAKEAAEVEHLSEATGLNTHELQAWQLGVKEAGGEVEGFNVALRKLSKELAGGSAKNQTKILQEYGLTALKTKDHAITLSEALPAIAEKFKAMADGPEKSAKATELFGRQGARLIPLLNQGAAGIVNLKKELDDLGGGFSPEFIKQSVELRKQTERLDFAWESLKVRIYGFLVPALTAAVRGLIAVSKWASDLADTTHILGSALAVLGALAAAQAIRILIAYAPVIATFAAWAAGIALAILLVEDLYGFFTGKNSLIGEAIDAAFGEGSQAKVREWFQSIWNFGKEVFGKIKEIFGDTTKSFGTRLDEFLEWLSGTFSTKIGGAFGEICSAIVSIFQVSIDAIEAAVNALVDAAKAAAKFLGIGQDNPAPTDAPVDTSVPPISEQEIHDSFLPPKAKPKSNKLSRKDIRDAFTTVSAAVPAQNVPVPAPSSFFGDSAGAGAFQPPVVNNNFAIPPGTPQQQQRAIADAAERGTAKGLKAPNRAAVSALSRTGK